jgi:hypothetical protein
MAVKQITIGTRNQFHRGRRTLGAKTSMAKKARQKANIMPRPSTGQASKIGALANSPLELHINAAAITQSRPRSLLEVRFIRVRY